MRGLMMTSWLVVACSPDNRKGNNNNTREQLKTNECNRKLINVSMVE